MLAGHNTYKEPTGGMWGILNKKGQYVWINSIKPKRWNGSQSMLYLFFQKRRSVAFLEITVKGSSDDLSTYDEVLCAGETCIIVHGGCFLVNLVTVADVASSLFMLIGSW